MNPIQSILIHVDAGPHGEARLQLGRALGGRLGASVAALYAVTPVYVEMALELSAGAPGDALLAIDETRRADARALVQRVCAQPGAQIEWREAGEMPEHGFIREALYADLLVLGQRDPAHRQTGVLPDFVQSVLLASGKPALVVPYIGARAASFETVFVAWKETRESARALTAALPLLREARTVHIGLDAELPDAAEALLQRFLARHGVEAARTHKVATAAATAGEILLSRAADLGADLMVMGCYGHSRARELVLGGASRTLLQSMTLPVLMAH